MTEVRFGDTTDTEEFALMMRKYVGVIAHRKLAIENSGTRSDHLKEAAILGQLLEASSLWLYEYAQRSYHPIQEVSMKQRQHFTNVPLTDPVINRLLAELKEIYVNGGAFLTSFAIQGFESCHWFISRTSSGDKAVFDQFLMSSEVKDALPELRIETPLITRPEFTQVSALKLDGEFATLLVRGGAYRRFAGTPRQAKELAQAFCDTVLGDRYNEVWAYNSDNAWSDWFHGVAWDATWIIVDVGLSRIWLLCVTDTD